MSIYKELFSKLQEVEKSQTIEEQFVADLNHVIELSKESHKPSKSIKPSSLGGCYREQWFMLMGADADEFKPDRADNVTIMESGNDRHNRLQNYLQNAKSKGVDIEWVDPEQEVLNAQSMGIDTIVRRRDGNEVLCFNNDYLVSFKCDGIIKYRGIKMILEIKTEDHFKWIKRFGPEPKHEFQAALYSICFGIDHIMFLYENRNYTNRKAYKVTVSTEFKEIVRQRIILLLAYAESNKMPPKEKDKCAYCKYKQACKKAGDTESYTIEQLNTQGGSV